MNLYFCWHLINIEHNILTQRTKRDNDICYAKEKKRNKEERKKATEKEGNKHTKKQRKKETKKERKKRRKEERKNQN